LLNNGLHGGLDAASIQWLINQVGVFQTSLPAGKEKMGVPVHRPEIAQYAQGLVRQRHQAILIALGIANMHPHVMGVYITDSKPDSFAKAEAHAVDSKEENLVAQDIGGGKQFPRLLDGQDIGNSGCPGRLDQGNVFPGFMQYPGVEEFQTIEIKLDAAPGALFQKFVEIIEQLVRAKAVNPAIKIVADTPDCPGVRINGFWL